jgi:hypothetical protein
VSGELDPTFAPGGPDGNGKLIVPESDYETVEAVALRPDGDTSFPPKSATANPASPNVPSGDPSALKRRTVKLPPGSASTRTIFPSGWTSVSTVAAGVCPCAAMPAVPKLGSRSPAAPSAAASVSASRGRARRPRSLAA